MKIIRGEIKIDMMDRSNSRLNTAEEKITELEDIGEINTEGKWPKQTKGIRCRGATSSGQIHNKSSWKRRG